MGSDDDGEVSDRMGDFLQSVVTALLYVVFIVLLPVALLVVTPFILLWPGKRLPGGGRAKPDIEGRYKKVLSIWLEIGKGLP